MGKRYTLPIPFGWYGVAFSDELEVGEVKSLHYFGRDIVLFRTESGEAKILDAYCPHLGANLGEGGTVKGESIACPFHGWQFTGDGICENVPYAEKTPAKADGKQCIPAYSVVELNKTIWCWYHPDNCEPLFEVDRVDELYSDEWQEQLEHYDWVLNTTVQETSENGADKAHFVYVHRSENVPDADIKHDGHNRYVSIVSKAPAFDEDGNFDTTGTQWRDSFTDISTCGPGINWQKFSGSFDTMMLALGTPITDDVMHLRFAFTQKKEQNAGQRMMAHGLIGYVVNQVAEDIPIWENKIYRPNPILCDGDGPISQFRKWFSQFYTEPLNENTVTKGSTNAVSKDALRNKIMVRDINK